MNQHPPSEDTGAFPPHRESPSWGSSDCSSQGGHQGGARPLCADGSAGRFQEPPPHLLRPEAHFARLIDSRGNQNIKGMKAHSKDPQVTQVLSYPGEGAHPGAVTGSSLVTLTHCAWIHTFLSVTSGGRPASTWGELPAGLRAGTWEVLHRHRVAAGGTAWRRSRLSSEVFTHMGALGHPFFRSIHEKSRLHVS